MLRFSDLRINVMGWLTNQFFKTGNKMFPSTYGDASGEDDEYNRPMTVAEKKHMFQKWKVQKRGTAGIPATWMWKELDELTLAEAIAMHRAMTSGRTWGEIQFDGLSGDDGYLRDFEYDAYFGDNPDTQNLDPDGRVNLGNGQWVKE